MDNNLVGVGVYSAFQQQVDPTHRAARMSLRPPETGAYGSYRLALKSGVIAAGIAGNSPVWEIRWGNNGVLCVVKKLRIQAVASATAFAATAADSSFSLYRAQGFSAIDGTGGTFATFTKSKANAVNTSMPNSSMAGDSSALRTAQGGIVIANTGALSGGTKVNDDNPIAVVMNRIVASAAAETIITPEPAPYLIDPAESPTMNPQVLNLNEGLVLMADAITATGTWRLMMDIAFDEIDPARYYS